MLNPCLWNISSIRSDPHHPMSGRSTRPCHTDKHWTICTWDVSSFTHSSCKYELRWIPKKTTGKQSLNFQNINLALPLFTIIYHYLPNFTIIPYYPLKKSWFYHGFTQQLRRWMYWKGIGEFTVSRSCRFWSKSTHGWMVSMYIYMSHHSIYVYIYICKSHKCKTCVCIHIYIYVDKVLTNATCIKYANFPNR